MGKNCRKFYGCIFVRSLNDTEKKNNYIYIMKYPCCRNENEDNMGIPYGHSKNKLSAYEMAMFAKTLTKMVLNWPFHMTSKKQNSTI